VNVLVRDGDDNCESFGSMHVTVANAATWTTGQMGAITEMAASAILRHLVLLIR